MADVQAQVYVITRASGTCVETELMCFQVICQDFSSARNVCKLIEQHLPGLK